MKISINWLKEYLETKSNPEEISDILTNLGLEVEKILPFESVKGGLSGVVAGKVLKCEKHPNADRLKLTKINIGDESNLQSVCGAPNVKLNQKFVVATVGTILHPINNDKFKITKSKIRGEISQGMLCAEDEIGIGNSHEGIVVLICLH